ncbi:methyltransferase domain-containing protein [Saccharopolyspora rosea]|uniref:Methyltransferase domain-containing protein n=1 Tax=Saccharopolyspora rosea TaxID=524884 RepID=A0ABW3FT58_9PSEU|nr:methyltransferase domain-containing protein [Saccharopolyspora rosea]
MTYLLDPAWHAEKTRLDDLAAHYDPGTAAVFDRIGVAPGWRCADIGAGGGSVVEMLADRVGPGGHVLAVDNDTRYLEPLAGGQVEVLAADITADPLPADHFDLVHARLLVEHLPSAEDAIGAMVAAVRPGGWLVVEDLDWSTVSTVDPPSPAHERVLRALRELFDTMSYDPCCGRTLPRALRRAGLDDVGFRAEPRPLTADRERGVPLWEMFVDQLAPHLLGGGLLTQADLDAFHRLWHDGESTGFGPLMVSAWGRLPGGA